MGEDDHADSSAPIVALSNCLGALQSPAMDSPSKATMARPRRDDAAEPAPMRLGTLATLLGYNLRRAQVAAFQNFARAMEEFALSPGQLGVLFLVEANPGL